MIYQKNNFNNLIKLIMEKLLEGEETTLEILREQFKNGKISETEFTGYGFFSSFVIPDDVSRTKKESFQIDDLHVDVKKLSNGIGFVLFIKNGIINQLEGFTYGDEECPENIEITNISYIYQDKKRDLNELIKNWEK